MLCPFQDAYFSYPSKENKFDQFNILIIVYPQTDLYAVILEQLNSHHFHAQRNFNKLLNAATFASGSSDAKYVLLQLTAIGAKSLCYP